MISPIRIVFAVLVPCILMMAQLDAQELSPDLRKEQPAQNLLPLELPGARIRRPSSPPAPPSGERRFVYYAGIDFNGDDLQSWLPDVSLSICADACRGSTGCKAFTFNTSKNACFVKSGYGQPTANADAISAALEGAGNQLPRLANGVRLDIKPGIDYFGADLREQQRGSLDECVALCLGEDRCVAFSYVEAKNWCSLKSTLPAPRRKAGVTSGTKF
jgi:hypothetical protein